MAPRPQLPPVGDAAVDVERAHAWSSGHRASIEASERCGCFHCLATFDAAAVTRWIGADTARCPRCGVDAVIGSASGYPIDPAFLGAMRARWFTR